MSKKLSSVRRNLKSNAYVMAGILLINFIGFYIIFRWQMLLYLIMIDVLFLTFDVINRTLNKRRLKNVISEYDPDYDEKSSLDQIFGLIVHQYRINRRYIMASMLGLILAILVVSQIYLLNSSYNQSSFDRYVNLVQPAAFEITLSGMDNDDDLRLNWLDHVNTGLEKLLEDFDFEVTARYTYAQVSASVILGEEVSERANIRFVNTFQFKTRQWTQEVYDFYSVFPSFPSNFTFDPSENLLIVPPALKYSTHIYEVADFLINNSITILADRAVSDTLAPAEFLNLTYGIDNYWQPNQDDLLFLYNNNMDTKKDLLYKSLYLPENQGWELFKDWAEIVDNNRRIALNSHATLQMKTLVFTDVPYFDDIILETYQARLIEVKGPLQSWGNIWAANENNREGSFTNLLVSAFSPLDSSIRNYQDSIGALQEFLVLITSPLIAIALYLVNFSLNMVQKRRDRIIGVMKSRGTANDQLYMMFSAEIMLGGLFASIVGMILSIPWTVLSLRTSGFFEFQVSSTVELVISNSWYAYVPILGFLISFNLHVMSIINVANISTDEELNEITRRIKPLWQEMYLDVILFILAIVYWLALENIQIGRRQVVDFLIYDVGPFILASMMIAGPMVFQRFYYPTVAFISNIIAIKNRGDLVYLTKKNVYLHRFSTSKLAALLTAGFILTILTLSVPYSFDQWSTESAFYEHGAEIKIEGLSVEDNDRFGYLDIPEVAIFSPFIKFDLNFISPYQPDIGEIISEYTLIGIDTSNYASVGYWNDYYSRFSLEDIVDAVDRPRGIGLSEKTLSALGMGIGSVITMPLITYDMQVFELNVTTDFKYFPNLVTQEPRVSVYGQAEVEALEILVSLETMLEILKYYQVVRMPQMYIKLAEGISMAEGKEKLLEVFEGDKSIIVTSAEDMYENLFAREQFQLINSTLEGFLVISILIVIISYLYFIFINVKDRQAEMGLYRVLGMKTQQFRKLFLIEGFFLLGITSVVGSLLGYIVSSNFFLVITENSRGNIPPIRFAFNIVLFGIALSSLLLITLLASLIPTYLLSRKQSGSLLRSI